MPLVSVIIPSYNAEDCLAETLTSVSRQSLADMEVILVDDGSSDATLAVARQFLDVMNLRILSQANAGPAAARNTGIRASNARFCAFLDADDLMHPERLALQVTLLESDPSLAMVHTDLMTFDHSGIIHVTKRAFSSPCGGHILDRLLIDNFVTTSTVMARRTRLLEVGLFDEQRRISEDFDLWLRVTERWPAGFIDRALTQYRRRAGSASEDKFKTGLAALDVIETFWLTRDTYRRQHIRLWRHSLAQHLCVAGAAASAQHKHHDAFRYLMRALMHEMSNIDVWKRLAKAVASPMRYEQRARADVNSGAS
jgi:glycosyltransferase involved in cell wall biosynthesis